MRFYECVLIIRPDVSMRYVKDVIEKTTRVLEEQGGRVEAVEYWGSRILAYKIKKRSRAYYVCLGIATNNLEPLYEYLKFNTDLLRYACIAQPKGLNFPTPLHEEMRDLDNHEEVGAIG